MASPRSRRSRWTRSPAAGAPRPLEVLRGAAGALASGRIRDLFVETHPGELAERGKSEAELDALLGAHGYAEVWAARRGAETHRHFRRAALAG